MTKNESVEIRLIQALEDAYHMPKGTAKEVALQVLRQQLPGPFDPYTELLMLFGDREDVYLKHRQLITDKDVFNKWFARMFVLLRKNGESKELIGGLKNFQPQESNYKN